MSRSTISTFQVFAMFPNAESARLFLESRLWPDGAICPACKASGNITTRKGGFYRCNPCKLDFTIRTGTVFERSHIPLHKWLYAMYLLVTARKGISSMQLAKEIGIRQSSAWFMLHRLREACGGPKLTKLRGIVEVDECFIGGKERNKHEHKKLRAGRGIRTGTVFERSHIPLHKWLYAVYLLVTARKGISSMQLAKEIGIRQSSAWFMLHRLREACGGPKLTKLRGIVEVDECFIGGKERNKHEHKKLRAGR
jgi:transposase-like protein